MPDGEPHVPGSGSGEPRLVRWSRAYLRFLGWAFVALIVFFGLLFGSHLLGLARDGEWTLLGGFVAFGLVMLVLGVIQFVVGEILIWPFRMLMRLRWFEALATIALVCVAIAVLVWVASGGGG